MTFYRFGITFRHQTHDIGLMGVNLYYFANQMFRDKKFPNQSHDYQELKRYVEENYREDIVEGFEEIWRRYQKAKEYHEGKQSQQSMNA